MTSPAPFIVLTGITKSWGDSQGVAGIDLTIARGDFVVLLGPSGCGKSTTLRLIAGLETPNTGRVLIDGKDVTALPPAHRGLSMVFQSYALFPHLSVAENIIFGLRVRGLPKAERSERLEKALSLTGLKGYEDRKPSALSGGQRQRVALARAIVAGHPLCLMDEPLSNLDAKLRHEVRQEIRQLQQELGMTVVYVTHDQTEAMGMADRIVLMKNGLIEQQGPPEDLYEQPATAFAASFVGSPPMALLPAGKLPPALSAGLADGLIGVRPEALRLAGAGEAGLPARVTGVEFLGGETLVYLDSAAGALIAKLPGRPAVVRGSDVQITWSASDRHLFEAASGKRISNPAGLSAPAERKTGRMV
ncbi:MAG: ABC transporter ATP-binding protein [Alphaproteobacteria bacterium]|nr:ABC transporter ATP-binding protein [Alphaproteobacteria bacterium]MBU0798151.1 ABC transporter ATP-binding protein [Alphaproteobacteria bacterium]MBU0887032.1 ABC transporter ATP-binding protein [Alphaproteobacteria bacterium]MBU1814282.1 ABC transporter ATP-binding protein [Alphaproteobacteria bacterium]MBU2091705.1 ABC transporter ATP-binding protein [Alphaproteobacteria bacterium]